MMKLSLFVFLVCHTTALRINKMTDSDYNKGKLKVSGPYPSFMTNGFATDFQLINFLYSAGLTRVQNTAVNVCPFSQTTLCTMITAGRSILISGIVPYFERFQPIPDIWPKLDGLVTDALKTNGFLGRSCPFPEPDWCAAYMAFVELLNPLLKGRVDGNVYFRESLTLNWPIVKTIFSSSMNQAQMQTHYSAYSTFGHGTLIGSLNGWATTENLNAIVQADPMYNFITGPSFDMCPFSKTSVCQFVRTCSAILISAVIVPSYEECIPIVSSNWGSIFERRLNTSIFEGRALDGPCPFGASEIGWCSTWSACGALLNPLLVQEDTRGYFQQYYPQISFSFRNVVMLADQQTKVSAYKPEAPYSPCNKMYSDITAAGKGTEVTIAQSARQSLH